MIAVIVDETVAIARQIALALQFLVKIVGIGRIAARQARIDDFDAGTVEVETGSLGCIPHPFLAANQNSGAETLIDVGNGGTHHLFFFTFGKDDALRLTTHALIDAAQRRGDRIATCRQFALVAFDVGNGTPGNAGFHRCLGDGSRDGCKQTRIKRHRNDVT